MSGIVMKAEADIRELVRALPEIYQPVYGFPAFDGESSRACADRWAILEPIVRAYRAQRCPDRPLRVLDIGCAQGYFAFKFAELGAEVVAVDYLPENIALCQALNTAHGSGVTFRLERFAPALYQDLPDGHFDFVLGLSVFHHIAQEAGFDAARDAVMALQRKSVCLILELARREEGLYWSESQPPDWTAWVTGAGFFKELGYFPTHLGAVQRPLVLVSDTLVHVDDVWIPYARMFTRSFEHGLEHPGKRFYVYDDGVIKYSRRDYLNPTSNAIVEEIDQEYGVLSEFSDTLSFLPRLRAYEKRRYYSIIAVDQQIGEVLYDRMLDGGPPDVNRVLSDVLDNLVELERQGLYHNDLRPWNVVLCDGRAMLIDGGAIQAFDATDCAGGFWANPEVTVYESFMNFLYDVVRRESYAFIREGGVALFERKYFRFDLPSPYQELVTELLTLTEPLRFDTIRDAFRRIVLGDGTVAHLARKKTRLLTLAVETLAADHRLLQRRLLAHLNQS
jgi:O-antigen chain-terminating methyltransferase